MFSTPHKHGNKTQLFHPCREVINLGKVEDEGIAMAFMFESLGQKWIAMIMTYLPKLYDIHYIYIPSFYQGLMGAEGENDGQYLEVFLIGSSVTIFCSALQSDTMNIHVEAAQGTMVKESSSTTRLITDITCTPIYDYRKKGERLFRVKRMSDLTR
ncbi:hypothetical protein ACH5RR_028410 [Cinchona calisaya]|uniref:Uncharacterized protein n=1 Tax=Cinchona calisaya TaxID=153742 RepID=A0ABD2YNR1_9GENT